MVRMLKGNSCEHLLEDQRDGKQAVYIVYATQPMLYFHGNLSFSTCHHLPPVSGETGISQIPCLFWYGPGRRLEKLLSLYFLHCGD